MISTDCGTFPWIFELRRQIFSFCDFETVFVFATDEIRIIFSNSHFLLAVVDREEILPQLYAQRVTNFIHCCQLVRLDKTRRSLKDILTIATQIGETETVVCLLCCVNGRVEDAGKIFTRRLDYIPVVLNDLLVTMSTGRGSIKNVIDTLEADTEGSLMVYAILNKFVEFGATREDIEMLVNKDREFLSNHQDVVKPFLGL